MVVFDLTCVSGGKVSASGSVSVFDKWRVVCWLPCTSVR